MTTIGSNAFSSTAIESIDLPDTVVKIGSEAFSSCSKLKSVKIPKQVTRIENDTFKYCSSLSSIQLPSGIEYIGYDSIPTSNMQATSESFTRLMDIMKNAGELNDYVEFNKLVNNNYAKEIFG